MAVGGGLAGGGTPAPTPAPGQVPVPTPPPTQPQPLQSACIQSANAAFASVVAAAIQQITTGASTGNAALVSAGTTALSNAITAYNTALAQYATR
jgi:hypothetical protein